MLYEVITHVELDQLLAIQKDVWSLEQERTEIIPLLRVVEIQGNHDAIPDESLVPQLQRVRRLSVERRQIAHGSESAGQIDETGGRVQQLQHRA